MCQLVQEMRNCPQDKLQAMNIPKICSIFQTKHGPKGDAQDHIKSHKYILCIIDEVTNYLITVPIFQARSEEIGETLIENIITKYYIPEYIIMDQDSAFMSSLMTYLLKKIGIQIKTVTTLQSPIPSGQT